MSVTSYRVHWYVIVARIEAIPFQQQKFRYKHVYLRENMILPSLCYVHFMNPKLFLQVIVFILQNVSVFIAQSGAA